MKIFILIFSFYLLGLSCLPCGDKNECTVKATTTVSTPINHDKHSQDTEHCTPFCTCSCCAVSVSLPATVFYKIHKRIFPTKKYPMYDVSYNSQVSFSIWKPPKLS